MHTDLITLPPSIFTKTASPRMTERYVHVNTHDIIDMMEGEGFRLDSATARASKTRDPLFTKHQLDFRRPDFPQIDGGTPRILFTNAHDGSSAAKFMMGVYRFICSNGLVVGSTYAKEVVRHSGEQARQLIERVRALSRNTGPLFAQIEDWTHKELSDSAAQEFARLAAVLRFGDAQRFDPAQLLETRRAEDEDNTLWRVFNRVQENALHGRLVGYNADGRQLASRPIKGLDKITDFNVQLWRLAEEFAA
jgi:Domain of unknown function (DUF932)